MPNENSASLNLNIKELFNRALEKWKLLAVFVVFALVISLLYTYMWCTPTYDSTGKIYIMNKSGNALSTSELSLSTYLTYDYQNLIVDSAVLSEVSDRLDNKYSVSELKGAISVNNPEDTRFIEITVRTASANDSKIIVDTICEVSQDKIVEIMGIDRVSIVRSGSYATSPSSPSVTRNVAMGVILACLIFAVIIFVGCYFNDKINEPDDIERYLGISVLGTIPFNRAKKPAK